MIQQEQGKSNPGTIEALKAATRQVVQLAPRKENFSSPTVTSPVAAVVVGKPRQKSQPMSYENFAEAFVEKITLVEQERAKIEKEQFVVDQELGRLEKIQSDLTEKKKQLETKSYELIKVKDKLKELDKEMSDTLKS